MNEDIISDPLLSAPGPAPAFDRTYFNLHGQSREQGFFVLGIGSYPPAATVDAYVCVVPGGAAVQRNLRLSTVLDANAPGVLGPLQWQCLRPHETWRLKLGSNPAGIEFDLVWQARSAVFVVPEYTTEDAAGASSYAHLFQSGSYTGRLSIDGNTQDVSGWHGQRDRSKGVRRTHDRLGMHLWIQAQLPDECIGFLYNEDRAGKTSHFEGASMRNDRRLVKIVALTHELQWNDDFELLGGHFDLAFADGTERRLEVTSTGSGVLMEAAGYNGWHGVPRGPNHSEYEVWPLDGSRTPRNLEIGITDALCSFRCGAASGMGISEYALTRSSSYRYRPGGADLRR